MPSLPANGARMVFFSTSAACCATCAFLLLRSAASLSTCALLITSAASCALSRSYTVAASSAAASSECMCAMSESALSCASTWPALTSSPGLELDAADQAGDFGGDVDAAHRAQRADGAELRLPLLEPGLDGADRRRRHRTAGHVLLDHVALEVIEADNAAKQQAHCHEHDRHALLHRFSVRMVALEGRPAVATSIAWPFPARRSCPHAATSRRRGPGTMQPCRRSGWPGLPRAQAAPAGIAAG